MLVTPASSPPLPPPALPLGHVRRELEQWITALPEAMIGALGGAGGNLKMPMDSDDGRVLTWKKWVDELIAKIVNNPRSCNDCWLVKGFAGDTAGYPIKKIASRGNANKWPVHRMAYFVMHPDDLPRATDGRRGNVFT